MMGIIPQHSSRNKHVPFSLKQDLRYLDKITEEVTYLFKHDITNAEELAEHINLLQQNKADLEMQYKKFSGQTNSHDTADVNEAANKEALLKSLKVIRKELRLCNNISKRVIEMQENMNSPEKQEQKNKLLLFR